MSDFLTLIKKRRSVYGIGNDIKIGDDGIYELVSEVLINVPSAYNSQSSRAVILLGNAHAKLWEIVRETLRPRVPENVFSRTEKKLAGFAAGYGTILFFEDTATVEKYAADFPSYAENFPVWSQHATGILQFAVWTALTEKNIGASLQHYNPLIDAEVKKTWSLPESWQLIAQMPFGNITAAPGEKDTLPLDARLKVFK